MEKLVAGGLGLVRHGGETVLVSGALPGERVLAELGEARRGVRRGRVSRVLTTSPWRREPDCPLAGRCGGCDFLWAAPEAALGLKSRAALGDLAEGLGLPLELVESPRRERYRARATLHLDRRADGSPGVGFYDQQRRLVEYYDCLLLAQELGRLVQALRIWAGRGPAAARNPMEISVMKAVAGAGLMAVFSPGSSPPPGGRGRRGPAPAPLPGPGPAWAGLPELLAEQGWPEVGLFVRATAGAAPRRLAPSGPDRLPVAFWPEWNLTLLAAPGGFTQVNPGVNRLLVEKILELAGPLIPGRALDLYSGLGNIALPLLKAGLTVTAVEEAPAGVRAARENGRGLAGLTVIGDRSESAVARLARQGRTFDLVVLDPPRAGARDLAPALAVLRPKLIVYVACHPAVLGRDLPALASLGYRPRRLMALDMFPRTSHVEALVALTGPGPGAVRMASP